MPLLVKLGRSLVLVFLLFFSAPYSQAQTDFRGFNELFDSASWNTPTGVKLNPQAISFVESYMHRAGPGLQKIKDWGLPYFTMMDQVLKENNLPGQLKYLAVIESGLRSTAVSWAGAVGPWQFMPATGKRYGLKISGQVDERMDYIKSTKAAARYLADLYKQFQDWLLVIAAYNGGEGTVNRAIRLSGSRDFWKLQRYLPAESLNHVRKFIATHYVFEGQGGATTLTRDEVQAQGERLTLPLSVAAQEGTTTVLLEGRYKKEAIIKYTGVDPAEFKRYNPSFDETISMRGNYRLRLSIPCMHAFEENKGQILEESLQLLLRRN
ncbi:MAG: lytic transglycosylase domain-containing protein [Bacteroidetes bacterium]|nr:lytic transglycosylase domain-containing protein [Bacteroidota bacterium]